MLKKLSKAIVIIISLACVVALSTAIAQEEITREFPASSGGRLSLDLETGGTVEITGTGGSSITVTYSLSCTPRCDIEFDESSSGLEISTSFVESRGKHNSSIDLRIQVPSYFDVEIDSMGGGLSIDGVDGTFTGETMGGDIDLRDVRGEARLETMGGSIRLIDAEMEGSITTMGGSVLFENVVGNIKGSSMGGNVRYKNVRRLDGQLGSPPRIGTNFDEIDMDSVQISTMGGEIEIDEAPEGADLHTMGGDIRVTEADRFVRAITMGGDIEIDSIDGWVDATTMGGNINVIVIGDGGDVNLESMSGDVVLSVPSGFGMDLALEIAFTQKSRQDFRIDAPGKVAQSVSPDWDRSQGSARKYIRSSGAVNGGGNTVKVSTVNGNITIVEGR
jgi:DUF4097 and DUF4098 domain-containing protein YvlB